MTGLEVTALKNSLGLTTQHLASLVGVHPTTVYRWESQGHAELRLEPLQHGLLVRLQRQADLREPKSFGQELVEGLVVGGTLVGLAVLLADLLDSTPKRRKS